MLLTLRRVKAVGESTAGELYVNGIFACYSLEDRVRPAGEKVPGKTAIPAGRYRVIITMSARFKRMLPLLLGVPNFEGVRIHAGNTATDTEGCILVGQRIDLGWDRVWESRAALAELQPRIQEALDMGEECWIEIRNEFAGVV